MNGAASCQDLTGETLEHCLAVGYSQTAISVTCGGSHAEDDHCGTFLELHMAYANFYVDTEEVIAEVHLLTENVTVRSLALVLFLCVVRTLLYGWWGRWLLSANIIVSAADACPLCDSVRKG